ANSARLARQRRRRIARTDGLPELREVSAGARRVLAVVAALEEAPVLHRREADLAADLMEEAVVVVDVAARHEEHRRVLEPLDAAAVLRPLDHRLRRLRPLAVPVERDSEAE